MGIKKWKIKSRGKEKMNEVETQILESLQFLVSMQKPNSERYKDKMADIMAKNHLLLHPIGSQSLQDKTKPAFEEDVKRD